MTIQEFIVAHPNITLSSVAVPSRPNAEEWKGNGKDSPFHYFVTLAKGVKSFQMYYTKGSAHVGIKRLDGRWLPKYEMTLEQKRTYENSYIRRFMPIPPSLDEFLDSLRSDCSCVESAPTWPEFAEELGMNVDSIRDKDIYESCVKIREELRKFFGADYNVFASCDPE